MITLRWRAICGLVRDRPRAADSDQRHFLVARYGNFVPSAAVQPAHGAVVAGPPAVLPRRAGARPDRVRRNRRGAAEAGKGGASLLRKRHGWRG
jgi:hypothetical protein